VTEPQITELLLLAQKRQHCSGRVRVQTALEKLGLARFVSADLYGYFCEITENGKLVVESLKRVVAEDSPHGYPHRPWLIFVDGKRLDNERGDGLRFKTEAAALKAGRFWFFANKEIK
jgi:hypothetical protein